MDFNEIDPETFHPLSNRILVEKFTPEVKIGSIFVPQVAEEDSKFGRVLQVGKKVRGVKKGDIVLIPSSASKFPDWKNDNLLNLITEDDIGGIVEFE